MSFQRYSNNEEFIKLFAEKLATLSKDQILDLMKLGQYSALGHTCYDASENHDIDQCDNCYSGDTECEMGGGVKFFGEIWLEVAKDLNLNIEPYIVETASSDGEEESEEEIPQTKPVGAQAVLKANWLEISCEKE